MDGADNTHPTVERGIPIPPRGTTNRLAKYPWRELSLNDSFFVAATDEQSVVVASNLAGSARSKPLVRDGLKFTIRRVAGGVRVWRIA